MRKLPLFNKAFGDVLRFHREKVQQTQVGLSLAIGGSESAVRKLESGERTPTATTIILIAEALEVEPDVLFKEAINKMKNLEHVIK
ncbi:MAG: helix-turn-helix transcriptional regulator [Pseudomonadota bacterium]